jgi:hypothetical protein
VEGREAESKGKQKKRRGEFGFTALFDRFVSFYPYRRRLKML